MDSYLLRRPSLSRHAMVGGALMFVVAVVLFWRSLTVPFGLLFWIALDGSLMGLALVCSGFGLYLWQRAVRVTRVFASVSVTLSLLLLFSIPVGFFFDDDLLSLILLTEVADSPWEVTTVSLDVTVLPEEARIRVSGEARLRLNDCCSRSIVLALPRESMAFDDVTSDNREAQIYGGESLAHLSLSHRYQVNDVVEVDFSYHNTLNRVDHAIVPFTDFIVEEQFAYVVEPYPWYPLPFGSREPVSGEIALTVPEGWRTLSNGALAAVQERGDGRKQEKWKTQAPADLSFVAGPYEVAREEVDGRTYAVYTRERPKERTESAVATLVIIARILESLYGPLPTAGYAVIEAPSAYIHHSAESQIGYLVSDGGLLFPNGKLGVALTAHEFAHGWWGDYVENVDPGNKMVNEALAEYSATLVIEHLEGRKAMIDFLRFNDPAYAPHQSARAYFTTILGTDGDVPLIDATHRLANAKGRWLYHMLRNRIGDELFLASLREILDTYGGKSASMLDIRRVFEKNSPPEKNVDVFFDQWLERPGVPELDYHWELEGDNGQLVMTIRQLAPVYDLFVEVAYRDDQGEHVDVLHLTRAEETFSLPATGDVEEVVLDPGHESLILIPGRYREYGLPDR